jgi:LysR family transcriptional regulator of beta-lactamase
MHHARSGLRLVAPQAAVHGAGVALAPPATFVRELQTCLLVRPFEIEAKTGSYWLTWLKSRQMSPAMQVFHRWIIGEAGGEEEP